MKRNKLLFAALFVFIIGILIVTIFHFWNKPQHLIVSKSKTNYERTLIVGADKDYPPFSYIDNEGNFLGNDIDILYLIADEIKVNVELHLMDWETAIYEFNVGKLDLLIGLTFTTKRLENMLISMPLWAEPYIAFGKKNYNIIDFNSSETKICAIFGDSIIDEIFAPFHKEQSNFYSTYTQAFMSVDTGMNDFVIAPFSTGERLIKSLGLKKIKPVGPVLNNSFNCIGVQKNAEELLQQINNAIDTLRKNGKIQRVNGYWLQEYYQHPSIKESLKRNIQFISMFFLIAVFSLVTISFVLAFKKNREVLRMTGYDKLTNLCRRETFEENMNKQLEKETLTKYTIILIDVDKFKQINDTYGHAMGDVALQHLAHTLERVFNANDILGRYGGDEFIVFMPAIPELILSRKLKDFLDILEFPIMQIPFIITASIGVATVNKNKSTFSEVFDLADKALYEVKGQGGNGFRFSPSH